MIMTGQGKRGGRGWGGEGPPGALRHRGQITCRFGRELRWKRVSCAAAQLRTWPDAWGHLPTQLRAVPAAPVLTL